MFRQQSNIKNSPVPDCCLSNNQGLLLDPILLQKLGTKQEKGLQPVREISCFTQ